MIWRTGAKEYIPTNRCFLRGSTLINFSDLLPFKKEAGLFFGSLVTLEFCWCSIP